ncbi:MAG TPA: M56 family metallopeptidase [Acidimicrobiales bacterium]|nr:M56 family metallopeptidase [Acidimicrobiales bacterium]
MAGLLTAVAVGLYWPGATLLARARWSHRAPRAAVLLWQATGIAGALAAVGAGLSVALAPLHQSVIDGLRSVMAQTRAGRPFQGLGLYAALGLQLATDVTIVLVLGLSLTFVRTRRSRARHRQLLRLVACRTERAPGALVLDDHRAAAYCLPGLRPQIVVSTGVLGRLTSDELSAVLAHERGHAHGRHGIVMLPFASLDTLLGWVPYARHAREQVAGLLEMAADDYAVRRIGREPLVSALLGMAGFGATPSCALGASSIGIPVRISRLRDPEHRSKHVAAWALFAAVAVMIVPVVGLLVR